MSRHSAPARLVSETKSSNQVQVPSWPGEGNIISRLTNTSINRQRKSMDGRVLQNRGKVRTNIRHISCPVKNSVSLTERLQHRMASPCPHLPPTSLLGEGASPSSHTWQSFCPPAPRAQLKAVSWLHNAYQNPRPHTLGSGSYGDNPLKFFWDFVCGARRESVDWRPSAISSYFILSPATKRHGAKKGPTSD